MNKNIVLEKNKNIREILLYGANKSISIDFYGEFTIYDDVAVRNFDYRPMLGSSPWQIGLLEILIGLLKTHSLSFAYQCHYYTTRFISEVVLQDAANITDITIGHIETWPSKLPISGWPFVSSVLRRWASSFPEQVNPDVRSFLDQPTKWEEAGSSFLALVTNDPERGALTEQELSGVQAALNAAYETGALDLPAWALFWFVIATGVRPIQIARMQRGDVTFLPGPEGLEAILFIPLAKGREADKSKRWKRKAPSVLAEVLQVYLAEYDSAGGQPSDCLFYDSSPAVQSAFFAAARHVRVRSDRLYGALIKLFPYRFRYTMGTRAIAHGASDDEVARLLTHRSTTTVSAYRAAMPQLQRPIAEAIGKEMYAFARAFRGRLIDDISQATRAGEGAALIRDFAQIFRMEVGLPVGACGTTVACHQDAPRACLQCHKFEPFAGAPWEDLLISLEKDLATEEEPRIRLITEGMIDAVNEIVRERDARLLQVSAR